MEPIVNVVLPVFAIMAAGYLTGRAGLLGEASSQALNAFVFYIALPALIFGSMARTELAVVFNWPFIAAFMGGTMATFALAALVAGFAFPNRLGGYTLNGLSAVFSNTGYMGIPLLQIAFGDAGLLPAVISTLLTGSVWMAIAVALLEVDRHHGHGGLLVLRRVGRGLVTNPLVMAAVVGLLYSWSGLALPAPVGRFADILGAAAAPCALFAMGLFMVDKPLRAGLGEVFWLTALKLLAMPAITFWLAFGVMRMDPFWAKAAVIQAALPTGALVFVLAQRYDVYIQRATSTILISTVFSVITLSLIFTYFGIG